MNNYIFTFMNNNYSIDGLNIYYIFRIIIQQEEKGKK